MWTKLDDDFLDHPKIAALGPLGVALHVSGMVYSGRQLTDGFIRSAVVPRLVDFTEVAEIEDTPRGQEFDIRVSAFRVTCWTIVRRLVEVGVWHDNETINDCPDCLLQWPSGYADGFYVHDYLKYNWSREKVLAEREAAKDRRSVKRPSGERSPTVERASADEPPSVSFPAPAPAPAQDEVQELPAPAAESNGFLTPPNGWTHAQASLVRKLQDVSEAWSVLIDQPSKVNRLNRDLGKDATTMALQHAWEEQLVPTGAVFPMLRAMAQTAKSTLEKASA